MAGDMLAGVLAWFLRVPSGVRWLPLPPGVAPVRSRTSNLDSSTKLLDLPVSRSTSTFLVLDTSSVTRIVSGLVKTTLSAVWPEPKMELEDMTVSLSGQVINLTKR